MTDHTEHHPEDTRHVHLTARTVCEHVVTDPLTPQRSVYLIRCDGMPLGFIRSETLQGDGAHYAAYTLQFVSINASSYTIEQSVRGLVLSEKITATNQARAIAEAMANAAADDEAQWLGELFTHTRRGRVYAEEAKALLDREATARANDATPF